MPTIFSDPFLSTSLQLASQTCAAVLSFYSMGDWDLDSGPHAWMTITLLAEPSSQPYSISLKCRVWRFSFLATILNFMAFHNFQNVLEMFW